MDEKDLLVVPTVKFVPFRKDNVLPFFSTAFRITDPDLKISAASAFYPTMAGICQNVFVKECFTERKSLDKTYNVKGFSDLAAGDIDMYVSLASEKNLAFLKQNIKELRCVPLFKDSLAILVNCENMVRNLSLQEIKGIYTGTVQNWKDVGGTDCKINNYQLVAESNVSRVAFNQSITTGAPANLPQSDIKTMPELVNAVGDDACGIGNIFWSYYARMYASRQTRIISVDGSLPTSKDYPLQFDVCMYYDANNKKKQLHQFVEYLLSEEGGRLVEIAYRSERNVK
ncbi:MAG: substrate-binding domain-containing protein [Fibrobacter sp.]|nr:substrate-binding domain-containing protein [Fibrobacter sp.]